LRLDAAIGVDAAVKLGLQRGFVGGRCQPHGLRFVFWAWRQV
jgi:hypothetical protein